MCLPASEVASLATVLAVSLCLSLYIAVFHLLLPPFARVFVCSDASIAYPLRPETISLRLTVCIGLALALCSVLTLETVRHLYGMNRLYKGDADYASCLPCEAALSATAVAGVRTLLLLGVGWLVAEALGTTVRSIVGWQRPHFLAACRPAPAACDNGTRPVSIDSCRPISEAALLEAVRCFPSAHAGHSAYAAVFTCLYLQSRFTFANGHSAKWLLQAMSLAWCLGVSASRVSDYWERPACALAGCAIGACVAVLACTRLRPAFLNCACGCEPTDEDAAAFARRRSEDRQRHHLPLRPAREDADCAGRFGNNDTSTEMVNMAA